MSQDLAAINQSINAADNNIVGAVHGIPAGTSGGTGTHLTATNALLTDIKANTRPDTGSAGSLADCSAPPTETGQGTTQFNIALATWKSACQISSQLADSGNGFHGNIGNGPGNADGFIQDNASSSGSGDFDESGFGWGSSCPAPPQFTAFGHTYVLDTANVCSMMIVGGYLAMLLAGLVCLRILGGAVS